MTIADSSPFADNAPIFAPPGTARKTELSWSPPTGLIWLSIVNTLLGVITLGIYHFWGRTEVRTRIWSAIRIDGEPLSYTGTGRELFIGFLIVFAVVLLLALIVPVLLVAAFGPSGAVAAQAVVFLVFTYLYGVAVYRALRYRLTRTKWRGIRGALVGNSHTYGVTSLWSALLIPITLGWIYPWRATRLQSMLVKDMRFGNRPFTFHENPGPLYGRFIVLWIGGMLVGALYLGGIFAIMATQMVKAAGKAPPQLSPQGAVLVFVDIMQLSGDIIGSR